ncbi:MAG TPA: penicillin-binding protein 2 [Candidatus Megaira endosymbiont of Nemacystus decipiens]|nr:penicillin-binding protein 2 [Candidatus Megaera endosymbiont of Nemacystus decipiens]
MQSNNRFTDKKLMTRRTFCIAIGKASFIFLLIGRMFFMQFIKKTEYKTLSDQNRIKTILLSPPRGLILDCRGKKIVQNITCFRLLFDRNIGNDFEKEIEAISKALDLDQYQAEEVRKRVKNTTRRTAGLIIDSISWKQVSAIEEQKNNLKAFFIDVGFKRNYLSPEATAHLVGYLGKPNKNSAEIQLKGEYFKVGKTGVEKYYEEELQGKFGIKRIEVNAYGKYVRNLSQNKTVAGKNITLNIDLDLQSNSYQHLPSTGASAVMMDCNTGGILLYLSTPSFDPNKFYKLSTKYWDTLINNPYKPLIDKCCKSLYPPGSIFKIVTFLTALEQGIKPSNKFFCSGKPALGGNSFRCARSRGHGLIDMEEAIKYSCNSYIYAIAQRVGPRAIIEMAKKLGLGKITGIDLADEKAGFVPTPEWKKITYGQKWTLGDTLNLSIGQGFLLVTPLQLNRLIAAIASDGKLFTPSIKKQASSYVDLDIDSNHIKFMQRSLHAVMNKPGGTGYLSRINYKSQTMAAKTGTAQVQAKKHQFDDLNRKTIAWRRRNHAIFTGYAPFENPKYALALYLDHGGGGGSAAAPIAKKIMLDTLKRRYFVSKS